MRVGKLVSWAMCLACALKVSLRYNFCSFRSKAQLFVDGEIDLIVFVAYLLYNMGIGK